MGIFRTFVNETIHVLFILMVVNIAFIYFLFEYKRELDDKILENKHKLITCTRLMPTGTMLITDRRLSCDNNKTYLEEQRK
jgi:heme/copper-type cytochrome/quinol oxidase subunit 2